MEINKENRKKAFTLVEILVAVLIMAILATLAVPMYERMVEKSRVSEVTANLKRLAESKWREMDNRGIVTFSNGDFSISDLDIVFPASSDFTYSLYPSNYANAVCAVRKGGDTAGTTFLYLGESAAEKCNCSLNLNTTTVCGAYCQTGRRFFCSKSSTLKGIAVGENSSCEIYGMDSYFTGRCNI